MDYYSLFSRELKLRSYARRSIQSYLRAVRLLENFYHKSLEEIKEEEVKEYWICCKEEFMWSNATLRISYSGIKLFFSKRMLVHIHHGKGAKDRVVPLPETTLYSLRNYWKTHKNCEWIFPGPGRDCRKGSISKVPVSGSTVQGALRKAVKKSGIKKAVRPHTFRHSYATHLIEAGVCVRHVQEYLGHGSLSTTVIYLHLTHAGKRESISRINPGLILDRNLGSILLQGDRE